MPDEQPTRTVAERDGQTDRAVLGLLIYERTQGPWAVEEVAREIGRNPTDSLDRLYGGGLIHRIDGFVWATRAAVIAQATSL
jgi:hypothetical protein